MTHSPANIVAQFLQDQDMFTDPADSTNEWPIFIGFMPDKGVQDNAAAIYDTEGLKDARLMSGEVIEKHGVQLRVRSLLYPDGWAKLNSARVLLSTLVSNLVTLGVNTYFIRNVSQVGTIFSMGQEEGVKRKEHFSCNFLITLDQVAGPNLIPDSLGEDLENIITKVTDYQIPTADSGSIFTNTGAPAAVELTLPPWRKGLHYVFHNDEDKVFKISAKGTDFIRAGGQQSLPGGSAQNSEKGSSIGFAALSTGEWAAQFGSFGGWDIQ